VNILANVIKKKWEKIGRRSARPSWRPRAFEGALGMYAFTPEGDGLRGGPMAMIKDGKPQLVKMVGLN